MAERNEDIYLEMIDERIDIARLQLHIIEHYDPKGAEQRLDRIFSIIKKAYKSPSEEKLEEVERCLKTFNDQISNYRTKMPDVEHTSERVKKDLDTLASKVSSLQLS